ncbi:hypothetical protein Ancab_004560 [Ancistrocladus abbreviatus]
MISSLMSLCFWGSVLVFLSKIQLGFAQNGTISTNSTSLRDYYITWDDLDVDEFEGTAARFEVNSTVNVTRVIVVDQSGKGDSVTVQGAVDMVSDGNFERVKIYILPGIYSFGQFAQSYVGVVSSYMLLHIEAIPPLVSYGTKEKVTVPRTKAYISFIGKQNQSSNTVISWNNKASDRNPNGAELGTYGSATISIFSDYFCASEITFENTVVAVPGGFGMQAVALRVAADKAMFYKVNILGAQDTLLDDTGLHYFYQCLIQGSVDFIFGNARSLYQDSVLHSIANRSGAIAAHHRNSLDENTGFSFLNCTINGTGKIYLGRAWGPYSTVVYSLCDMDDVIHPAGWSDWNYPSRQKTTEFGEFQNRGRGADTSRRVSWARNFSYEAVKSFLDMKFIDGDKWLRL